MLTYNFDGFGLEVSATSDRITAGTKFYNRLVFSVAKQFGKESDAKVVATGVQHYNTKDGVIIDSEYGDAMDILSLLAEIVASPDRVTSLLELIIKKPLINSLCQNS